MESFSALIIVIRFQFKLRMLCTLQPLNPLTTFNFQPKSKLIQAKKLQELSSTDAEIILGRLLEQIRAALVARAVEIEYLIGVVVEIAIASFLDAETLSFVDCKSGRRQ